MVTSVGKIIQKEVGRKAARVESFFDRWWDKLWECGWWSCGIGSTMLKGALEMQDKNKGRGVRGDWLPSYRLGKWLRGTLHTP